MNHDWEDRLSKHLGIPKAKDVDRNAGSSNRDQKILQRFFRARIKDRESLEKMIVDRYRQDYDFIAKVIPR